MPVAGLWRRAKSRISATVASSQEGALRIDAATAFAIRAVGAGLAFLLQIALARLIGETGYGIFALAWIWMIVLGRACSFGFGESAVRFLPRYEARGQSTAAAGYLGSARMFVGLGSLAAAALAVSVLQLLPSALTGQHVWPFTLAMLCLPLFAGQELYEGIARAKGWNIIALTPIYLLRPTFIIAAFFIALWSGAPATAATAILAAVAALSAALIIQVGLVESRLRRTRAPARRRRGQQALWLKASLPLFAVHWCEELLTNADMVILGFLVPAEQVGVYFAASKIMILAALVTYAIGVVIGRRFAFHNAAGDDDTLQALAASAAYWTFWPTVAAVCVMAGAGYPLLWMFGTSFLAGYPILLILAAGYVARAVFGQAEDLLIMLGHQRWNVYTIVFALIANTALNLALIPLFGLAGAAIATSLTMAGRAAVLALVANRLTGINATIFAARRPLPNTPSTHSA